MDLPFRSSTLRYTHGVQDAVFWNSFSIHHHPWVPSLHNSQHWTWSAACSEKMSGCIEISCGFSNTIIKRWKYEITSWGNIDYYRGFLQLEYNIKRFGKIPTSSIFNASCTLQTRTIKIHLGRSWQIWSRPGTVCRAPFLWRRKRSRATSHRTTTSWDIFLRKKARSSQQIEFETTTTANWLFYDRNSIYHHRCFYAVKIPALHCCPNDWDSFR